MTDGEFDRLETLIRESPDNMVRDAGFDLMAEVRRLREVLADIAAVDVFKATNAHALLKLLQDARRKADAALRGE